jgi:putative phage-type endonuclease
MTGRGEWLASRRKGIGGSDAAAILNLSPWRTQMDVWLDKTGRTEPESEVADPDRTFLLQLGTELEAGIARLYTLRTGRQLQQIVNDKGDPIVLHHRKYPFILGSPDRLVLGESRGVEIKTENSFQQKFGEPGDPGAIPLHYEIQCRHYMAITDRDVWDLPVLKGAAKLDLHTIERDLELEEMILERLVEWWQAHVLADVPPPIDGSDAWKRHLATKFPRNVLPIVDAGSEVETDAFALARIRRQISKFQATETKLENKLKAAIGEHDGLQGAFGKVTWKKTKDSTEIDYQAAFSAVVDIAGVTDELRSKILVDVTHPKPGVRRFLLTLNKETKNRFELADASQGRTVVDAEPSVTC